MVPLRPEDLNLSAVPRGPLGHLKTEAVGDLLQRAAWDYREALALNQRLTRTVEELQLRMEELSAQMASLEETAARRKDPDELMRTLLSSAQKAAREERESARRDAELILKKAARRAERRDEEVARYEADRLAELVRLEGLKEDVVGRLRGMLEALASRYIDGANGGVESHDVVVRGRER
jgi:cell division septum initiation protein DivIVA